MTSTAVTFDALAGDWRIYQLQRGHRFSTDDLLTAWAAQRARPQARRLLDLGAGVGSVGLLVLWRLGHQARLTMVEVQTVSCWLAGHTVAHNGLGGRVSVHHQDLRHWPGGEFDLVTGSPPYTPLDHGVRSRHPQKAAARFELHGDVFDYCRAAARSLAADGIFCFCHAAGDERAVPALDDAGLTLLGRQTVYFRAAMPPSIALYVCARHGRRRDPPPITVRDHAGHWTDTYLEIRKEMGASAQFLARARTGGVTT